MRIKMKAATVTLAAIFASLYFLQSALADKIYQEDSRGNINQINIGVGKTNSYSGEVATGISSIVEREKLLKPFSELVIRVPADVIYKQGGSNRIVITGHGEVLDQIEVQEYSGALIIKTKANFSSNGNLEIEISGSALKKVELSGAIDARLERISVSSLSIAVDGVVDLKASGKAGLCTITLNGSGDADLKNLKCGSAVVTLEGASDLHVYASDRISGSLMGAADVTVSGNPGVRKLVARGAVDITYE
jgi:hypothetical protein